MSRSLKTPAGANGTRFAGKLLLGERKFPNDVFLSVCQEDSGWAAWLKLRLQEKANREVFFYAENIGAGEGIHEAISGAIRASEKVLLILSPTALRSGWCKDEWELALKRDADENVKRTCVVVLRRVPDTGIPECLKSRTYVRLDRLATHRREFAKLLAFLEIGEKEQFNFRSPGRLPRRRTRQKPRGAVVASQVSTVSRGTVAIFGAGYVGLSLGAALGKVGYRIIAVEINTQKRAWLRAGQSHLVEPGVDEALAATSSAGRLHAPDHLDLTSESVRAVAVCLGPNLDEDDVWDTRKFERLLCEIGYAIQVAEPARPVNIVLTGTLRPDDLDLADRTLRSFSRRFVLAVSPLFVREGTILSDLERPPHIIVGTSNGRPNAASLEWLRIMRHLVDPDLDAPTERCLRAKEAALLKLSSNAFHALKVCFANEVGRVCRDLGVDASVVMQAFAEDRVLNISSQYLTPGFVFGGWCLTKDTVGLATSTKPRRDEAPVLLESIASANRAHFKRAVRLVREQAEIAGESSIGLLGVTFKAGSDDLRASPAVQLIRALPKSYQFFAFDDDLRRAPLTGVNAETWRAVLADSSLTRCSAQDVFRHCSVIVLAKSRAIAPLTLRRFLRRHHTVVDLVGDLRDVRPTRGRLVNLV